MNRLKIIIISITVVLLLAVAVLVFRFIQSTLFAATEALQRIGETPIVTEIEEEEKWVAPPIEEQTLADIDAGMDSVDSDAPAETERPIDVDDDIQAVPVDQTPEELANTSPDDLPDADLAAGNP